MDRGRLGTDPPTRGQTTDPARRLATVDALLQLIAQELDYDQDPRADRLNLPEP